MKISVVTVCLNSEKTISYMVESFLRQRHADKELVVIDGASRDRTVNIVRSFGSENIRIYSEPDFGIYDAMNKGLRHYRGDAVGFLGSDDAFHDGHSLQHIANALEEFDVAYGDLWVVKDHESKRVLRTYKSGEFYPTAFRYGWMPAHPTFYLKRNVIEAVGLFDTRYEIGSDYDFTLRVMRQEKFASKYIREVLVDFKIGGVSSRGLRSILTHSLESLDSRRRWLGSPLVDLAFFLKPARALLQRHWR